MIRVKEAVCLLLCFILAFAVLPAAAAPEPCVSISITPPEDGSFMPGDIVEVKVSAEGIGDTAVFSVRYSGGRPIFYRVVAVDELENGISFDIPNDASDRIVVTVGTNDSYAAADFAVGGEALVMPAGNEQPIGSELAAAQLREGLRRHLAEISVEVRGDGMLDQQAATELAWSLFISATEPTSRPDEGDYIKLHITDIQTNVSGDNHEYTENGETKYTYSAVVTYYVKYTSTAEMEAAVDRAANELLDELDLYEKSDYEKINGIYDWICKNVSYDFEGTSNEIYTAYAALVKRKAVCQGYALLFNRLAGELGVESRIITGRSMGQNHAWNIVKLGGKFYNVDCTWDSSRDEYAYFLKGSNDFDSHERDSEFLTDEFELKYPTSVSDYSASPDYSIAELRAEPKGETAGGRLIYKISAEINGGADDGAEVVFAAYENGALTDAEIVKLSQDGAQQYSAELEAGAQPQFKVFVLNGELMPLGEVKEI